MRTVTTTREYDNEGRMVRETVVETDHPETHARPCSCGYSTWCPTHGYARYYPTPTWPGITITSTTAETGTTVNSATYAAELKSLASRGINSTTLRRLAKVAS